MYRESILKTKLPFIKMLHYQEKRNEYHTTYSTHVIDYKCAKITLKDSIDI